MRRGTILPTVLVVLLGIATPAFARGNPHQPPNDEGYACADIGPVWDLGDYQNDQYTGTISNERDHGGVCIDLRDEHRIPGSWTVTWTINVLEGDLRGLWLLFNKGLTGSRYAEFEVSNPGNGTETWTTDSFTPDQDGPFAFVAMRDIKGAKKSSWSITFTVTPPTG